MTELETRLREAIRDVPDFPEPGILFKDITPILLNPSLCREVVDGFLEAMKGVEIDVVAGVESRGFLFGLPLAMALDVPFVTVRKKGKLPYHTVSHSYDLEYGSAEIEMHRDAIHSGQRVLVHDDLLATGGTAAATSELVATQGAQVVGFTFLVELVALGGRKRIEPYSDHFVQLVSY